MSRDMRWRVGSVVGLGGFFAACASQIAQPGLMTTQNAEPRPVFVTGSADAPAAVSGDSAAWGYGVADGPAIWADLSPNFAVCRDGQHQSPIDLAEAEPTPLTPPRYVYQSTPLHLVHEGHTVRVVYEAGSTIDVDARSFTLQEIHFHTPSEHALDSAHAPVEMHLAHQDPRGRAVMVAVLINEGFPETALADLVDHLPLSPGDTVAIDSIRIDAGRLVDNASPVYRYHGSSTTPPCGEGVRWIVLENRLELDPVRLNRIRDALGHNARPIQPVNERRVRHGG